MEGQRSFCGFRSRNGSKLPKSRASNKGVQVRNVKPQAKTQGARGADEKNVLQMAGKVLAPSFTVVSYNTPFILPSHLLRPSSYMNFFRIQCNFVLYKYIHTFFSFFPLFLFYFLFFFFFVFRDVPGCSGTFRNVPECSMFRVLSTALKGGFHLNLNEI